MPFGAHVHAFLQDVLCVNQHEETEAHQCDVAPATFSAVVQACGGGTIVVLDSERCSPATRAWCIFEWCVGRQSGRVVPSSLHSVV